MSCHLNREDRSSSSDRVKAISITILRGGTFTPACCSGSTRLGSMSTAWFIIENSSIVNQWLPSIAIDGGIVHQFVHMIIAEINEERHMCCIFDLCLRVSYIAFLSGLRSFEANSGRTSKNRMFGPGWDGSSCWNNGVRAKRMHSLNRTSINAERFRSRMNYRCNAASASRCFAISKPNDRLNRRANS